MQSQKLLSPSSESVRGKEEEKEKEEREKEEEADLSVEDSIFFSTILILFSVIYMTICFASKNRWYIRGFLKMLF